MPIGLGRRRRRAVSLEEGAGPGAARCPACGEPLFAWVESEGFGPREVQLIDRCESCGLVVPRDAVPTPEVAVAQLLGAQGDPSENGKDARRSDDGSAPVARVPNAASLQAWFGAENWAALRPQDSSIKPTPLAAELLLARRGLEPRRIRQVPGAGMASMWQTLLNLLTFHRDFAAEAGSRRLRPGSGQGLAAYLIDAMVTVLAAVPTAILAVLLEGGALLVRRGGVIEIRMGERRSDRRSGEPARDRTG